MKKIILVTLIILMSCGIVRAEDKALSISGTLNDALGKLKLEDMRQGTAIDLINNKKCYTFTKPAWTLKAEGKWYHERLALGYGYTSTDKLMVGASANLLKMGDFTDIPIIDLLRLDVGLWGGYGRIQIGGGMESNNEWSAGAYFTLLKVTK